MSHKIRNILIGALLSIGLGVPYLQAADVAISALPAGSALGGTEPIPMVQGAATKKTTPADIDTYISGTTKTLTNKTINASSNTIAGLTAGSSGQIQYNNSGGFGAANIWRESADITAQRNSTTAQTLYIYDTYTDASNYGRIAINTSLSGDWVQVAAQTAGTGGDNYGIALTPSGTGAISWQLPDSTAAGGNARGANAVDWQMERSNASQVASGQQSSIGGGRGNTASGVYAVVAGGANSSATNNYASIVGGLANQATAAYSSVAGGSNNVASGQYSWSPGGQQAHTRGLIGAGAYSSGHRAAQGDAQVILQPVRRTTTDATPASLATDGTPAATTVMVLPSDSTATCQAIVTANTTTAGVVSMAGFRAEAIVKNDSSTMTISGGTCTAIGTADAALSTATCALVANGTLDSIEMEVTGVAATTIYWVSEVKCVQAL